MRAATLNIYRKAIAAALVAILGLAAQFLAPDQVAPETISTVAGLLSVAVVYLVPNLREGQSVDFLAAALVDIARDRANG